MVVRLTQWTPSRNIEFFINCEEEGKKLKKENRKENSFPSTCKLLPEVFFNSRESLFFGRISLHWFWRGGLWVHLCPWKKLLYLQLLDDPTLTPLPSDEIWDITHYYAFFLGGGFDDLSKKWRCQSTQNGTCISFIYSLPMSNLIRRKPYKKCKAFIFYSISCRDTENSLLQYFWFIANQFVFVSLNYVFAKNGKSKIMTTV